MAAGEPMEGWLAVSGGPVRQHKPLHTLYIRDRKLVERCIVYYIYSGCVWFSPFFSREGAVSFLSTVRSHLPLLLPSGCRSDQLTSRFLGTEDPVSCEEIP